MNLAIDHITADTFQALSRDEKLTLVTLLSRKVSRKDNKPENESVHDLLDNLYWSRAILETWKKKWIDTDNPSSLTYPPSPILIDLQNKVTHFLKESTYFAEGYISGKDEK